jgi:hypothetical protein
VAAPRPGPGSHPHTELIFDWGESTPRGLGDCIRGMFAAMAFCDRHGLRFWVDTTGNPLERFLQFRTPLAVRLRAARARPQRTELLFSGRSTELGLLVRVEDLPHCAGTALVFTNGFPERLPTERERAFVRSLLVVRPVWRVSCPPQPYSLLHIRTQDSVLVGGQAVGALPDKAINTVRRCMARGEETWLLVSDSEEAAALARHAFPALQPDPDAGDRRFSAPPGHVSDTRCPARLATTIRDMQRVCGAREIVTVTSYRWTSGFALWLGIAFDIKVGTYGPSVLPAERMLFGDSLELE